MPRPWISFTSLLMVAACGSSPGGADDDDVTQPDAGPDGPAPCVATGPEVASDGVDNDCDGIVDELFVCGDGSQPFTTIGAAIAAAPAGSGVEVCAGTYAERLVIDRAVRINGAGADSTIIDAGNVGHGVFADGHEVTLSGLTIRNGHTTSQGGAVRCLNGTVRLLDAAIATSNAAQAGGGLYALNCTVQVERTRFSGNAAANSNSAGGAIALVGASGAIVDSDFDDNSSEKGGAVSIEGGTVAIRMSSFTTNHSRLNGGALYLAGDTTVEDSTFTANTSGWTGGAVYVWQNAPTFTRNVIADNKADWEGGGFYIHQSRARLTENQILRNESFDDGGGLRIFESALLAERNVISGNKAADGDGGAFKNSHVAGMFIDNQITDNWALGAGGGIEADNDSSTYRGGVVSGNHASIGGGIHAMLWPWNGGSFENIHITGNDAWRGGGMYLENSYRTMTIRNLRIDDNEAHQGGGMYVRGTPLVMSNTLITANRARDVGGAFYFDPSASYPWTSTTVPPPPIDPPTQIEFVTAHANTARNGGAAIWIGSPNVSFESSIFSGHVTTGVIAANGVTPTWRYNDTFPATFQGMAAPTGTMGNLASDPAFMAADNFHLQQTSVCRDAGNPAMTDTDGTRADMGKYAGPHAQP